MGFFFLTTFQNNTFYVVIFLLQVITPSECHTGHCRTEHLLNLLLSLLLPLKKLIPELQKLFVSKNETNVLKLWPLFVKLLGKVKFMFCP